MEPKPWMRHAGLVAVTAVLLLAATGAAAEPLDLEQVLDDPDPLLTPPVELGELTKWALVTFEGSTPVTVKPFELMGIDPQDPIGTDPTKAIRAAGNGAAQAQATATEDPDGAFDLHIIDWPGGNTITEMSLLISAPKLPTRTMTVVLDELNDNVVFVDVPVVSSANYVLKMGSDAYSIAPLLDAATTAQEQVCPEWMGDDCITCGDFWFGECLTCVFSLTGDCLVEPMGGQPMAANADCPRQTTLSNRDWERYDRGWIGASQAGWTDLAWGGWQYKLTYRDGCGYGPTTTIKPAYGFGFRGLSRLPVGGTYETHFGADWTGSRQTSCQNYGSGTGYRCNGHYAYLHSPSFSYRTPAAPGAAHKSVSFGDMPATSCSKPLGTLTDAARAALTLIGLKYNWVGLFTRAIPNYTCTTNWNQLSTDPTGGGQAAMGAKLSRDHVAWNDDGRRVTGYVRTEYPQLTPRDFSMDLFATVSYEFWANICGGNKNCNWASSSGSNYYEVLPAAAVV